MRSRDAHKITIVALTAVVKACLGVTDRRVCVHRHAAACGAIAAGVARHGDRAEADADIFETLRGGVHVEKSADMLLAIGLARVGSSREEKEILPKVHE